ncbi:hypothetical protein A8E25_14915 [Burkholderia cenocepacia]|nr:hypothetical protein BURCENK562V_C0133 [Burkholderia cenocepacia K56-2Valvano]ERI27833.1 hypothetical protein BURCENBC7_AP7818 [Burkholderia cenocepacia BC7]ONR60608.1 hypothetical protein A8E17_12825 [Burkholderia cenocepacia]ONR76218.1 hypothetical protein A8E23_05965 [Burkholderia cenocepacia]ONR79006.1 hypothetical protein A8E18_03290 [Burkholderia cenocepacia]
MARDSRHCRESRRAVQVRAALMWPRRPDPIRRDLGRPGRRRPVLVGRPVQFGQKRLRPYLSVYRRRPKYWCDRTRATRRLPCANCDFT